ncbi:hypothetical protein LJB42_002360 [Komagataella kurtzmanii]|nr:hypothetical protein LJB42_002360 [Komagataella kurtzmanii]
MSLSPDAYHGLRQRQASLRAQCPQLKMMELRAHTNTVADYHHNILLHHLKLEQTTRPQPQSIAMQPEIRLRMRPMLLDHLVDIFLQFKLSYVTFFLTVNLLDRYTSLRVVRKQHYQLLGLTCLWIAAKYSEKKTRVPTVHDLTRLCLNTYSKTLFLEMESHILKSLDWNIGFSTHNVFLDLVLQEQPDIVSNTPHNLHDLKMGAIYLCELAQFHPRICFHYSASAIAVAALALVVDAIGIAPLVGGPLVARLDADLPHHLLALVACPPPSLRVKYASPGYAINALHCHHQVQTLVPSPRSSPVSVRSSFTPYASPVSSVASSAGTISPYHYDIALVEKKRQSADSEYFRSEQKKMRQF